MQDPKNIYWSDAKSKKEKMQRKRWTRHASSPEGAANPPPDARAQRLPDGRMIYRKRIRRKRSRHIAFWVWTGVSLLVLAYLVLLARQVATRRGWIGKASVERAASQKGEAENVGQAVPLEVTDQRIRGNIRLWSKAPAILRDAKRYEQDGDMDNAVRTLEQALERTPRIVALQVALARLYMQQRAYERVCELAMEAIEADPQNNDARYLLAGALAAMKNAPAALAVADWILETVPDSLAANRLCATAYIQMDKPSLAVPYLRRLEHLEPDNTAAQFNLAVAYQQLREYDKAIDLLEGLLRRNRAQAGIYFNLAVCYARRNDAAKVVDTLNKATIALGREPVSAWVGNKEFDRLRAEPVFASLQAEMQTTQAVSIVAGDFVPLFEGPSGLGD